MAAFSPPLDAADVVYERARENARDHTRLVGEIIDYTGRQLRLRTAGDRERTIDAEKIVRVETTRTAEQTAADALFTRGDFAAAGARYEAALQKEPRRWVRREIIAQVVWCRRALGQLERAGQYFVLLYDQDPTTQMVDCIPLAWYGDPLAPSLERQARSWLAKDSLPVEKLLGASHLLATGDGRQAAIDALDTLATGRDGRIAALATAQLWRTALVTARAEDVQRWQAQLQQMDEPLRAGPYYLLGRARVRLKQYEAGALALLHVPALYGKDRQLSAASLYEAGRALQALEREEEAAEIFRQLVAEHPRSPWTDLVRVK